MLRLIDYLPSGNCYKVRLLLTQLGVPFERTPVTLRLTLEAAAELRKINPLGRVPTLILENGEAMGESNAILLHFADGTPLMPVDRMQRARVYEWLFWEQYDHEPTVAVIRAWIRFFGVPAGREADVEPLRARAHKALSVLESHLVTRDFLVGETYSIADIALFAYTHVAPDGGVALDGYPAIRAWIERVQAQPGHIPITAG